MLLFSLLALHAQEKMGDVAEKDLDRVGPHIKNTPMPKGFLATYRLFAPFPIESKVLMGNYPSPGKGKVSRLEENEFKIKIPFLLRENTNYILGLKYRYEEYHFERADPPYPLYRSLEDKHLNYLSMDLYIDHKLKRRRFLTVKLGTQLIGDYNSEKLSLRRFMKHTLTSGFGWKKTDDMSIGFGVYANYIYGSYSIYPVFIYNKAIGENWALQLALPASANIYYKPNAISILSAGVEFDGASYNLSFTDPGFEGYETVELARSDLLTPITYEREIYDFLWFTATVGYRYNVGFNINQGDRFQAEKLMKNKISGSPYFSVGLFLTLPKKYRKAYLH